MPLALKWWQLHVAFDNIPKSKWWCQWKDFSKQGEKNWCALRHCLVVWVPHRILLLFMWDIWTVNNSRDMTTVYHLCVNCCWAVFPVWNTYFSVHFGHSVLFRRDYALKMLPMMLSPFHHFEDGLKAKVDWDLKIFIFNFFAATPSRKIFKSIEVLEPQGGVHM